MRPDSRLIRASALSASGPVRCRANSSATVNRASGDRNSCEISFSNRDWALTSFSICSAIKSKSFTNCDISSPAREVLPPARAVRSPAASFWVAFRNRRIGEVRNCARK